MRSFIAWAAAVGAAGLSVQLCPATPIGAGPPPSALVRVVAGIAAQFKVGGLVIDTPWMRATPPGAAVAGGYLRITNQGQRA